MSPSLQPTFMCLTVIVSVWEVTAPLYPLATLDSLVTQQCSIICCGGANRLGVHIHEAQHIHEYSFLGMRAQRISGSVVASIASSGTTIKARDRSMNEPMYADRLLGLDTGALGPGGRQPYWACRRIVSQAYFRRVSLRASYHAQSAAQPEVQLQDLTPVAQKCVSTLVQLCFHPYAATSRRATRSCASLVSAFPGLPASLLTAAASSMTLMDATDPGFVPEELSSTGGYRIPPSIEQATEVLAAQTTRLEATIAAAGDHSDAEDRCTSDNKHRVTGAVALLEVCQATVPVVAALEPAAFTTIYLSMLVIQGYSQVVCTAIDMLLTSIYTCLRIHGVDASVQFGLSSHPLHISLG